MITKLKTPATLLCTIIRNFYNVVVYHVKPVFVKVDFYRGLLLAIFRRIPRGCRLNDVVRYLDRRVNNTILFIKPSPWRTEKHTPFYSKSRLRFHEIFHMLIKIITL